MKNKKTLLYIIIGIIIGVGLFLIFFFGLPNKKSKNLKSSMKKGKIVNTEEGIEYSFFYPSEEGNYLVPIKKKINKKEDLKEQIKQVIIGLFNGPDINKKDLYNPFSKNLKINEFYLIDNSIVVLDLNDGIYENLLGGTDDEILTIYSIVDTISYNFPFVRATQIIINGREAETLAGHIDISRPLRFDPKWIRAK